MNERMNIVAKLREFFRARRIREDRKSYLQRKGWSEEMVREYQSTGSVKKDRALTEMIEQLKPYETLESGVQFKDKRRRETGHDA